MTAPGSLDEEGAVTAKDVANRGATGDYSAISRVLQCGWKPEKLLLQWLSRDILGIYGLKAEDPRAPLGRQ